MVVTFERPLSIKIVVSLLIILGCLQYNFIILGLILAIIVLVVGGIKNSSYKFRELVYYFVASISLLILLMLPVQ